MIIPLFIAILLGLVSPSQSNSANPHNNTTVSINSDGDDDGGDNGGGDSGDDGAGDTGGENGHVHPPKP